ncbi:hypothetical protein GCM10009574_034010 [Streptomyces asiaticus]|uniref:Uncharacterized protein n=2 Tax=Streptomyces rhizosphaericus TaxID=114699 RepID=A0ABN1R1L9_9ACTN
MLSRSQVAGSRASTQTRTPPCTSRRHPRRVRGNRNRPRTHLSIRSPSRLTYQLALWDVEEGSGGCLTRPR